MRVRSTMSPALPPVQPSSRFRSGCFERVRRPELGADRALARAPAALLRGALTFHMRQQVVAAGVGRRVPVVGAVELEEVAHLVQPRVDAEADPLLEREVLVSVSPSGVSS